MIKKKLEEKEERRLSLQFRFGCPAALIFPVAQETFSSLQQEVEIKSKQLRKAWDKVVAAKKAKEGLLVA